MIQPLREGEGGGGRERVGRRDREKVWGGGGMRERIKHKNIRKGVLRNRIYMCVGLVWQSRYINFALPHSIHVHVDTASLASVYLSCKLLKHVSLWMHLN